MRLALLPLLGALVVTPALAQGYYPGERMAAREDWHRAHRAEEIARWRAANGDYAGANRAHYWAERHRDRARREAWGW